MLRWGEPRLTRDVDLTIVTAYGAEAPVVDGLLGRFTPRIDDARAFALQNRVLLLAAGNDVPLDVALGALTSNRGLCGGRRRGASERLRCERAARRISSCTRPSPGVIAIGSTSRA